MPVLLDRSFFRVSGSFRAWDRKVNMWLGVRPDVRGLPGAITPLPPVRSRKWLVPPALIWRTGRTGSRNGDTNGLMHETVKEPAMPSPLLRLGSLALLFGLIVPGGTADAAGIGLNLRGHAHNIPHAVAGGRNPRVGVGAGEQPPSRPHSNTRSIQMDTTGESAASRSRK